MHQCNLKQAKATLVMPAGETYDIPNNAEAEAAPHYDESSRSCSNICIDFPAALRENSHG